MVSSPDTRLPRSVRSSRSIARALRLERAKDLIRSTALPLKAIAPEVGFGSAQHLCRLLHDRFGVGVRELRGAGTLESRGVVADRGRDSDDVS